ncbi:hypothetical protein [Desulfothermobacter acidiphilus]|uniref:hypothetical protein n=1 Tax=Desulfothermobacter acidiphilus TaxID=1938353 RepID=UPI003F8B3A54
MRLKRSSRARLHFRREFKNLAGELFLMCFQEDAGRALELVEKRSRKYHEEIARLKEKLERASEVTSEKAGEAERYRRLAEEALETARQIDERYRAEVEALKRRVVHLERRLKRLSPAPLPLDGARVLVAGHPAKEGPTTEVLEELGAEVAYLDASDKDFDAKVLGYVDLVVIAADWGSHAVTDRIKSRARSSEVPVVTVPSGSPARIREAVLEHFGLGRERRAAFSR